MSRLQTIRAPGVVWKSGRVGLVGFGMVGLGGSATAGLVRSTKAGSARSATGRLLRFVTVRLVRFATKFESNIEILSSSAGPLAYCREMVLRFELSPR